MIDVAERVWGRGELTNGSKMTYKDNYALYAYKPPSPMKPSGKGKTGKNIKGGWYPNYSAYKAQQGRSDLPFELTGSMRFAWFGGQIAKPLVKSPLNCQIVMDDANAKKAEGLAKTKGPFLVWNDAEREVHAMNIERELRDMVLKRA